VADVKPRGDCLVGIAHRHERHDLVLARSQPDPSDVRIDAQYQTPGPIDLYVEQHIVWDA
jgi:hypothetical protein